MKELARVFGYTKNLRHLVVLVAFISSIMALLNLAMPFVIKLATDAIVAITTGQSTINPTSVIWFAVIMFAINIVTTITENIGGFFGDVLSTRMREQLSNRYFSHLLTLPQRYFDDELTGTIINRLNRAITDIAQFVQFFSNNLLRMILTLILSLAVMIWYSWPLAILIVILIPTYIWLTNKTSAKWQVYEKKKNKHFDIASGRFAEVIGQVRLVKSFHTQERERKSFAEHFKAMVGLTRKQSTYWHGMNALRTSVLGVIYGIIYATLFYQAATKSISIGDLVLLSTLVQQISYPLQGMSYFVDSFQRAVANSRDYAEAMEEKPEVIDETGKMTIDARNANIEFNNVNFSYGSNKQVLHDISFIIKPGQKMALVGESGGGKSTIANLLMRLYTPKDGRITINGVDIQDASQSSLRASIATVFQDASLFSGTVRENIAYANPHATDKEIIAAAEAANAYEFIKDLKKGLDTEIGERGIKLSGGQKQRIAIARALLKDAPILILDEATSSLDSRSEAVVQEALDRLMKGRTVLIIAHRLSTIAHVDKIVTLKHGKVDEIGSPAELSKTEGIYAQLLELQMATTEKAKEKLKSYDMAV